MNEHEFRDALRTSMAVNPEPPPMAETMVLDAAHRDRRRRRTLWAGVSSAAAVAAIAAGVVAFAPAEGGSGGGGLEVASQPGTTTRPPLDTNTVTTNTEVAWPNGQSDNLDVSGPEYVRAGELLDLLVDLVPDGFEVPADLLGRGELDGVPLLRQVAQHDGSWAYHGQAPLTRGDGVGSIEIMVFPIDPNLENNQGCGEHPACTEKTVDGKVVAVFGDGSARVAADHRGERAFVSVRQSTTFEFAGYPAIDQLPFTTDELVALVTDPRFQLD